MTSKEKLIKAQNDFCNVTKWHDEGFTGLGVNIWNMETSNSIHSVKTLERIKDVVPNATVFTISHSFSVDNDTVTYSYITLNGVKIEVEDFIKDYNIKILTKSVAGKKSGEAATNYWKNLQKKYNLIMFNAAGNEGTDGISASLPSTTTIYVAGCTLVNGVPRRDNSSSIGEDVDFIDFRGYESGTSFASPYLAGKTALLVEKYGSQITQEEVYNYFKVHSLDIETKGEDDKSGWGLPKMGTKTTVIMQVGNTKSTVDGFEVTLDQSPIFDKTTNRVLVPVRAVSEPFGVQVSWDSKTQTVTLEK